MKKKFIFIIVTLSFFLSLVPKAYGIHHKGKVTPYGDFCSQFRHYGGNKSMHNNEEAKKALQHYFNKKGLDVGIVNFKGRFIKAHIKKSGKVVDIIIFDRKSGRIRSIY
jgi:hypothetical protein